MANDSLTMPETGTAYDMSFSTFGRINYWLWKANEAQAINDVHLWVTSCKILYKELYPNLSDKKKTQPKEKHRRFYSQIMSLYRQYLEYETNYQNSPRKGVFQPPKKIFDALFEWEFELRLDLDDVGILMKKEEGIHGAIFG